MGSHYRQVAILVQLDKLDCFVFNENFLAFDKVVSLFIWDQCCFLSGTNCAKSDEQNNISRTVIYYHILRR